MYFGWGLRLSRTGPNYGGGGFAPLRLFALGEQGAWYDPSDLTTLYQDSAGTTPVTAHGQPVGLMLDKSGNGRHASQPTAASRPLYQSVGGLQYLLFDGIDDFLVTGSIDFTATDKVSVFAGVRKLSDAAAGAVVDFGTLGATVGVFRMFSPVTAGFANYNFSSTGDGALVQLNTNIFPAPTTNILTGASNISGPRISLRVDAIERGMSTSSQGAGAYGNHPLYIGRRGGTSLPFTGHLYGLIIRGALTDDPTTIKVEQLLATKTGVTL